MKKGKGGNPEVLEMGKRKCSESTPNESIKVKERP